MNQLSSLDRILVILALIIACGGVRGQGKVRYLVNPYDRIQEKLDGQLQRRVPIREVSAGEHRLTFYAPGFELLDTMVMVEQNAILDLRYVLKVDPDYQRYRDALKRKQNGRLLWVYTPGALALSGLVWTANAMKKEGEAYDALKASEASYYELSSPREVQELKDDVIPTQKQELKDAQRTVLTASIFTGTMAAITAYGIVRSSHKEVPPYEDKHKVRFDGIAWLPGSHGGVFFAGLTIPIR